MLRSFKSFVIRKLLDYKIITNDEIEIYEYGYDSLCDKALHLFTILIISVLLNLTLESFIFLFATILVRKYSGGYHMKTKFRCYATSLLTWVIFIMLNCYIVPIIDDYIKLLLLLGSAAFIFVVSPQGYETKELDSQERVFYRRKARVVISILYTLSMIFFYFRLYVFDTLFLTIVLNSVMLLFSVVHNVKRAKV